MSLKIGVFVLLSLVVFGLLGSSELLFFGVEAVLFVLFFLRPSRRIPKEEKSTTYPPVSIVVPMRNEEGNARACIDSLRALDYPAFEIVVGDDSSTDSTRAILDALAQEDDRLHIVSIPPIEAGWTGKAWATSELVKEASHELVLVVDADVRHAPESLRSSVIYFLKTKSDIMARFPYPIMGSVGEWPLLFLFFVLRFSAWFSTDFLFQRDIIAKEEYLLFTRTSYDALGGYRAFKSDYPMIVAFFAAAARTGKRVTVCDDDTMQIRATAYEGFAGTFRGMAERVNFRKIGFAPFFGIFLMICFSIDGLVKLGVGATLGNFALLSAGLISYSVFALFFGWYLHMSREPLAAALVAPFLGATFLVASMVGAFRSLFRIPLQWKGRHLAIK